MERDSASEGQEVGQLVNEILLVVETAGKLEAWVAKDLDDSIDDAVLDEAFTQVAHRLLTSEPPQIGYWDQLLVTMAVQSTHDRQHRGLNSCRSVIHHLSKSLHQEHLPPFNPPELVSIASALTVALAIQGKLSQDIEEATGRICEKFPEALPEIAHQCQDIWMRRGQMSGKPGLFVWDLRLQQWRLAQDFKRYRPPA